MLKSDVEFSSWSKEIIRRNPKFVVDDGKSNGPHWFSIPRQMVVAHSDALDYGRCFRAAPGHGHGKPTTRDGVHFWET